MRLTDTNSLDFRTDDTLVVQEVPYGQNFGWEFTVTPSVLSAASTGGELHLHALKFDEPGEVLGYLAQRPTSGVVSGAGGQYFSGQEQGKPGVFVLHLGALPISTRASWTMPPSRSAFSAASPRAR